MSGVRALAPEVVQTSAMDCGPAALTCLLEGFGIPISYGRLREACQTNVDGTSIDTLEDVALALGLAAEQVVIPVDHVLHPRAGALPAIAVVTLPSGATHFVVVWRTLGPWVQIMDPSSGRIWRRRERLSEQLYQHTMPVPAAAWREWAGGDEFLAVLRARMLELGCRAEFVAEQVAEALADPGWVSLARLDAGARMLADLTALGGLARGSETERSLVALLERAAADPAWIPERCWSARALPPEAVAEYGDETELVLLRGAVLLRATGLRELADEASSSDEAGELGPAPLAGLRVASRPRPLAELARWVGEDGLLRPSLVAVAILAAAVGVLVEAAILRGLVEIGAQLGLVRERLVAWSALVAFAGILLVLEGAIAAQLRGIGRRLEARLRVAFLTKIPRLGPRYFQSRLNSDMAERLHSMHGLRRLPTLVGQLQRTAATLVLTVIGVAWLDRAAAVVAGAGALGLFAITLAAVPTLRDRDLRFRTHAGALSRVYLDALLGLWPIRAHGAGRAVRREHEGLLVEWLRAGLDLLRASVVVEAVSGLLGAVAVVIVVAHHSLAQGEIGAMLLLVYWSMQLPALGQQLGQQLRQLPGHRSRALRLLEPLGAEDEHADADPPAASAPTIASNPAAAIGIDFEGVRVVAGGHVLLDAVDLHIAPGEHVAIVGASGAGKSTLVGALLGWHRPSHGRILADGQPLTGARTAALRRRCAWVDPAIALWNQPLLDNLLYGGDAPERGLARVGTVLADAELRELVANLPDGLQSPLGEGGGLLSGGEGQRVRLARALLRPDVGLAILDEPLRGLDRARRRALLERMRERWRAATLLCVSHDLDETRSFPRVIVIDGGRVVEDGDPRELAARPGGAYAGLLAREREVHAELWRRPLWRRVGVREGRLDHASEPGGGPT